MTTTSYVPVPAPEVAQATVVPSAGQTGVSSPPRQLVAVTPTQVRRPWRSTVRTFFQALIPAVLTLGVVVPEIVKIVLEESGDSLPDRFRVILLAVSAGTAAAAAALARIMAIPAVELLLRRFKVTRFLSAAPKR